MSNFDPKSVRVGDTIIFAERYSNKEQEAQVVAMRIDDPEKVFVKFAVMHEEWVELERVKSIKILPTIEFHKNK